MKIKSILFKTLPSKITIDNKEYHLENGYIKEIKCYYFKYCNEKGIVPVVNSETDYYALSAVEDTKKKAKNKLFKLFSKAKKLACLL